MSKTLLLADDSVTIQKVVGITFASEDVELVTVDNGDDALIRAREIRPDLVLADVSMPGLDGYELCHAIKSDATLATTPVILLTGTFEVQDESRAKQVGADAQIAKPFEAQALVDMVRGLIGSGGGGAPKEQLEAPVAAAAPAPAEVPAQAPTAPAQADALLPEAPLPGGASSDAAQDTDFSFSDLEFAKEATTGPAPDATVVMGGPPPLEAAPATDEPLSVEPLPADPISAEPIQDAPLSAELLPEEPQGEPLLAAPLDVDPLDDASSGRMTEPRFSGATPPAQPSFAQPPFDDPLEEDADSIPNLDEVMDLPPAPSAYEDLAYEKTNLMPPDAARGILENNDLASIPEEPISLDDPLPAQDEDQPVLAAEPLAAEPMGVDASQTERTLLASDISTETIDAPAEVRPLGEQTFGGSEIFGDPLSTTEQTLGKTAADEQTEPDAAPGLQEDSLPELTPEPMLETDSASPVAGVAGPGSDEVRNSIEKLAWDAFGPMSEQLVHEVVKKIEEIAWDVVPQLAERMVQEELRRLTADDD